MLKAAMAKRGYNLSMLAAASGISLTALSQKVNGKTDFWGHEISAICIALDLSGYELISIFFPDRVNKNVDFPALGVI